jgi:hypothetical protein
MNTKFTGKVFHILFLCILVIGLSWKPSVNAFAGWTSPLFMLNINNDSSWHEVTAWNWPLGSLVTLTVDNPDTFQNPDYTETQTMGPRSGEYPTGASYLQNNEFEGHPGFTITLTDGIQTKSMIVPLLQGTEYDLEADTVSGVTNPFAHVVVACDVGAEPTVFADSNGNWMANFRDPENPDVVLYDVRPGTWCEPQMYDQDRDHIVLRDWNVPLPIIETLGTNKIVGGGWPLGSAVTITIDDPSNGTGVDFTVTQMPFEVPWYPEGSLDVPIPVEYFLEPGFIVEATNGDITKTLVYTNLEVTEIDTDSDIIRGKANPGAGLHVQIHGSGGIFLDIIADANGDWVAEFQGTYNLTPNTRGRVSQSDMDGDTVTHFFGSPRMIVYLLDDYVQGLNWKLGATVTLTIDDPENGVGVDYTDTQIVEVAWWNPSETDIGFLADTIGIRPGQLVVMTDGITTTTHVVSHLIVTEINTTTNTVAGITDPGGVVEVGRMCDDLGCAIRRVTANNYGSWLADFSVPGEDSDEQDLFDIRPGASVNVNQNDNYGNSDSLFLDAPLNTAPNADAGYDQVGYVNSAILLDASNSSDPEGDELTYAWDLDNDGLYDDASGATVTTSFSQTGEHIIGLMVTDESGLSDTDTVTVTILPWTLTGFYHPVDMNGVYNLVKNGSTVPLKFEVSAGSNDLTEITTVKSLTYAETACNSNAVTDEVELTTTGGTSLHYDAQAGQFVYNWKTPSTVGKCYRVKIITLDGSSLMAYFKLK